MDTNVFALLTSGARFDKKRFEKDLGAFNPGRAQPGAGPSSAQLPASASGQASKARKRKEQPGALDINVFQNQGASPNLDTTGDNKSGADAPRPGHSRDPHEEANLLRKRLRIHVKGDVPPPPLTSFDELGPRFKCGSRLLSQLRDAGWEEPTPVQRQVIPALMEDRDVIAIAPTGSGKTLAFMVPAVIKLKRLRRTLGDGAWPDGPKALVLSPTHELAAQQGRTLSRLLPSSGLRASVLGRATAVGSNFSKVDVLVANPLRLAGMVDEKKVDLSQVRLVVLDEADKLFQLGFLEQVDRVLAACTHPAAVRALLSATLPDRVEALAAGIMSAPLRVTVGERNAAADAVKQRLMFVGRENGKLPGLRQLLAEGIKPPVLVFVNAKERAAELHRELLYDGVHVDSIHADQSQSARAAAVENFRLGRTWVLVATDLVGRGMDFIGVNTVVNYDFPRSTLDYIHRIGRTGRAGHSGEAVTFFTEEDAGQLRAIANIMRAAGCDVPGWMLKLSKERNRQRRREDRVEVVGQADEQEVEGGGVTASREVTAEGAAGQGRQRRTGGEGDGKVAVSSGKPRKAFKRGEVEKRNKADRGAGEREGKVPRAQGKVVMKRKKLGHGSKGKGSSDDRGAVVRSSAGGKMKRVGSKGGARQGGASAV